MPTNTTTAAMNNSKEQNPVSTATAPRRLPTRLRQAVVGVALALCCALLIAGSAQAAPARPAWSMTGRALPTNFTPGSSSINPALGPGYAFNVTNVGAAASAGDYTFTATLPVGVTPTSADVVVPSVGGTYCEIAGRTVTCTNSKEIRPGYDLTFRIAVAVALDAPQSVVNHVTMSGGGAETVSEATTTTVGATLASFGFLPGLAGLSSSFTEADGSSTIQAGSHPYQLTLYTDFRTKIQNIAGGNIAGAGHLRDVGVKLPEGVITDPTATPVRCTESQLETTPSGGGGTGCPDASQVGVISVFTVVGGFLPYVSALYNMEAPPGAPAQFGFNALNFPQLYAHITGGVDAAGNYALTASSTDLLARPGNPIVGVETQLWGDPSSPSHDYLRAGCIVSFDDADRCPVPRTRKPLLTMPGACSRALMTSGRAASWEEPTVFDQTSSATTDGNGNPVGVSGCSRLAFDPSITLKPDVSVADSPSGVHVSLKIPQTSDLDSLATANLKDAVVTLPEGVSLSASAADGLSACSPAQIGMGTNPKPTCPDSSKIGTVEVDTPLLDDPLHGAVYVAAQNDNPSNSVLGIYVVAEGPGVVIKLAGHVVSDQTTGQLTTTFENNPQLPFSEFKLDFFGGSRAALATPDSCGTFTTTTALSPWSGTATKTPGDSFPISSGCDGGFAPAFDAGVTVPSAGQNTDFSLHVSRSDGQQHIKSITTTLPAGVLANVGSVAVCPEAEAAAGTCAASSQVGVTDASAGPGSNPFHVAGKVFLTGPYKGGPYGLSIVVQAVAGPFNLGTVVVRAAIRVDPIDAHVTVVSDDVPSILDATGDDGVTNGFPLRIRTIAVDMNRAGFMVNPTSCDVSSITGTLGSWEGATASVSSRFKVGGCSSLALSPKLAISLTGKGQTTDNKHPGVHATVSQPAGQANLKKVVVSLPLSLALDPDNAQALCEFTDGSKVDPTCPKGSIVGKVVARTPILDQPLTGPVYFVKNIRKDPKSGREIRTLPKLVIPLTGPNGLRLNLVGTSNVVDNHLVSTFDNIPDAPVSDFTLDIDGGKSGILVVSGTDICKATQVAEQQIDGQNGKQADTDIYLQTPACPLKIISKKVSKTSVAVKVGGLGAGKVTITGKGIKKTTKTISKSTVATITAKRTKGKPGKVKVSFVAAGAKKARAVTAALR